MRPGERFRKLQERMRNSRLIILDERSMIGRMFVGKMVSRVREFLGDGSGPPGTTLGGQDLLMIGDDKQCAPIGDEPQYQEGGYAGRSKGVEDGPRPDALVGLGLSLRNECRDVVVLRTVHRLDDGDAGMAEDVRAAYRADGEKFVRVVGRLADCQWKAEEHAWLSQRNRSRLMRTEAGRRQLAEEFDDPTRPAVLLMDGRVRNRAGKEGADQRNA